MKNLQIGNRFNIVSCVSFIPYILLSVTSILQLALERLLIGCTFSNVPGSLVLRYFGVRNWLAGITLAWGAVQLSMGYIHSWHLLVLCRVLLGALEVGIGSQYKSDIHH